ncbi:MAG: DUF397 domain-containing protein [Pseudonocardiales bacterium]|nr:DUF397 domain-containing protein [Pseudonocardiales bacterium]MBV9030551.1 DUF397 domain-containing protein [Pseudonocardiales bacterium]MBW0011509.1 DUF397 domain-containing protein [Pseudonocardiales bacterium]
MGTPEFSVPVWRTSSRSNGAMACLEVAVVPGRVGVRNSKDRSGPALVFFPSAWRAFVGDVRHGGFDHG